MPAVASRAPDATPYPVGLSEHLAAHRVTSRDLGSGLTEGLLARLPEPPEGKRYYELGDRGRRAVGGLRVRRGRTGTTFLFGGSIRQPDGSFKSAQVVLGKWRADGAGMSLAKAREAAAAAKAQFRAGVDPHIKAPEPTPDEREALKPITLRAAYDLYTAARTGKKKKPLAPATQVEYRRIVEVALKAFADRPLADFGSDPRALVKHFNAVSERTPAEANTQMRVLRAIWNRAHKVMPGKVPAPPAIWDMNEVTARNAAFVTREIKGLWQAIGAMPNAYDRKGAYLFLLLGLREGALLAMKWEHIDHAAKTLFVPWTKGKSLLLPLSEVAYSALMARMPENDLMDRNPYVFPSVRGPRRRNGQISDADETARHVDKLNFAALAPSAAYVAQREDDAHVHPHVFRHTYRTLATSAGANDIAIRLLMGHSLQGDVSFDYLTADIDWLRRAQDLISAYILESAGVASEFRFGPDDFYVRLLSRTSLY